MAQENAFDVVSSLVFDVAVCVRVNVYAGCKSRYLYAQVMYVQNQVEYSTSLCEIYAVPSRFEADVQVTTTYAQLTTRAITHIHPR